MRREDWDRRWAERELPRTEPNRFLVAEVEHLAAGRALDLGSGAGRNAVWLAERGWRVTAVDFSDVGMAKARCFAAARGVEVDWVLADLLAYEPPVSAFDLVLYLYVQLPAEERRLVLERAAAAVAPGGMLLVIGHDLLNLTEGWGGPKSPEVLFTPEDIAAELPGLVVERTERVRRPVETEEGVAQAIDALVRASRPAERAVTLAG